MICKKCGSEIENGLMYCPKCGESIQLVPEYDVLEEELLSKVVEDKRKAKDSKFATGVYKPVETIDETDVNTSNTSTNKSENSWLKDVFTKKIKLILFVSILVVCIFSSFLMVSYLGAHTYDSLMNKAIDAENEEKYAKALGFYEEAYSLENDSFEAIYGLGRMYYQVKDYDRAIKMLKAALAMDSTNKKIYTYLLDSYDIKRDQKSIYELAKNPPNEEIKELIGSYITLPPNFNIEPGTYTQNQIIQLTCTGDNEIFYTLNGKNPTTSGKLYTKPITLKEGTTTIKAVTQSASGEYSEIITGEYVIEYPKLGIPVVSPTDGVYSEIVMITIDVPEGCKAFYNWDGSDPAENGFEYTEPFPMIEGAGVLSVVIKDEAGNLSPVYRGNYIYQP